METVCNEELGIRNEELFTYPSGFATSPKLSEELDGLESRVSCLVSRVSYLVSCISIKETKSIGLVVPG